ncbi:MAG: hypothetical protein RMA76_45375 [Deltaproteobacteria bacterium]
MLTLAFALLAATPSADLDGAVTRVVSDLRLADVSGFSLDEDLAVVVSGDSAWTTTVAGLIRGRLLQLGVEHTLPLPPGSTEAAARQAGAEWLLRVQVEVVDELEMVSAQLVRIDRGLWAADPHSPGPILAIADRTFSRRTTAPPPPPPPPTGTPSLAGPAVVLSAVPGRVLAMGACAPKAGEPDELVVVTQSFVRTYRFDKRGLDVVAELDLSKLPRAPAPAREPFGAVVCDGDAIGFGTTDLDRGYRVVRKGARLEIDADLTGMPVGRNADGWVLAQAIAGRNLFASTLTLPRGRGVEITPSYAMLATADRAFVVTTAYTLVSSTGKFDDPQRVGRAGSALAHLVGSPIFLHTAPELTDGGDVVSMYSTEYPASSVRIPSAVQALTIGRFREGRVDVLTASWRGRRDTEIRTFSVADPPEGNAR